MLELGFMPVVTTMPSTNQFRPILADCPAVSLDLCIYTAGGGNPLYREELLKQCSSVKKKAIGLIFIAELESCMHKADVRANK